MNFSASVFIFACAIFLVKTVSASSFADVKIGPFDLICYIQALVVLVFALLLETCLAYRQNIQKSCKCRETRSVQRFYDFQSRRSIFVCCANSLDGLDKSLERLDNGEFQFFVVEKNLVDASSYFVEEVGGHSFEAKRDVRAV
ncbi:hypothetical protein MHBO_000692 [Bonamia ostreae]|uniref:Uncharacterized protein n=1 Tax=Bonamia ostreae TaxID=126728 RepID=A0ABV2AGH9_9EUKA